MALTAGSYRVPQEFAGKDLRDIRKTSTMPWRTDVVAQMLGIPEYGTAFAPDQTVQFTPLPGREGSGEYAFIQKYFTPSGQVAGQTTTAPGDFQTGQRDRLAEFTGRLGEVPTELEAIRQSLGIPQAYETFGQAGQTARTLAQQIEDIPQLTEQAATGRDVTANQLQRMIAAKTLEAQPALTAAGRGLEASQAGLQNLLSQYQTRTQEIFTPLEIEAGMLGENIAQEYGLFKTQIQADLDRELAQLSRQTQLDIADIQRATQLAQAEQAIQQGSFTDLGDRIALINPVTGQEIQSFSKGLTPARGTSGSGSIAGDLSSLYQQWMGSQGG